MVNEVPPLSNARRSVAMVQFPHRSHTGLRARMLRALRVSRAPGGARVLRAVHLQLRVHARAHPRAAGRGRRAWCRPRWTCPPRPPGEREPLILSVGRFFSGWHSKNQHVLLEAFARARRAGLVAGAGGRGGRSRLRGARRGARPRACRSSCASTFHATSCWTSTRAPRCSGTPRATARTPAATPSGWSTSASRRSRRWRTARSRWSIPAGGSGRGWCPTARTGRWWRTPAELADADPRPDRGRARARPAWRRRRGRRRSSTRRTASARQFANSCCARNAQRLDDSSEERSPFRWWGSGAENATITHHLACGRPDPIAGPTCDHAAGAPARPPRPARSHPPSMPRRSRHMRGQQRQGGDRATQVRAKPPLPAAHATPSQPGATPRAAASATGTPSRPAAACCAPPTRAPAARAVSAEPSPACQRHRGLVHARPSGEPEPQRQVHVLQV